MLHTECTGLVVSAVEYACYLLRKKAWSGGGSFKLLWNPTLHLSLIDLMKLILSLPFTRQNLRLSCFIHPEIVDISDGGFRG